MYNLLVLAWIAAWALSLVATLTLSLKAFCGKLSFYEQLIIEDNEFLKYEICNAVVSSWVISVTLFILLNGRNQW